MEEKYKEPFPKQLIDEYGRLIPAPNKFPSCTDDSFKPIADDVHDKGRNSKLKQMLNRCRMFQGHTGPGHWADCNMIPLGVINICESADTVPEPRVSHVPSNTH
ncbi:MAG: hypothetical protein U5R06_11345 [candidate division KSB1 bacterium]|nr:hypothetical protein [candidate division KSB1 bacterium]